MWCVIVVHSLLQPPAPQLVEQALLAGRHRLDSPPSPDYTAVGIVGGQLSKGMDGSRRILRGTISCLLSRNPPSATAHQRPGRHLVSAARPIANNVV